PNDFGIDVSGNHNHVGTTFGERNYVSGNSQGGVLIEGQASENYLVNDFIGTDLSGTKSLGYQRYGVGVFDGANHNHVGLSTDALNLISGNAEEGVLITDGASDNTVAGAWIGVDVFGALPVPNGTGVVLSHKATRNTVGGETSQERDVISGNSGSGVLLDGLG